MSTVQINKEEVVVYAITLPGETEPIVLRVPSQVAKDLWLELENVFAPTAPIAPSIL